MGGSMRQARVTQHKTEASMERRVQNSRTRDCRDGTGGGGRGSLRWDQEAVRATSLVSFRPC